MREEGFPSPMSPEGLPPPLRDAVSHLVDACRRAFGPHLRCVIVKGSAIKGDFMPGYSDLDLHAFVDPETLMSDRTPKLEYALRFQEAIGPLDPRVAGASQFQVYFLRADRTADDWTPSVPGSYEIVYGDLPRALREWKTFDFKGQAKRNLARIPDDRRLLIERTLDKPNRVLATYVRFAGTVLKGHAYSAALLASEDAPGVLRMRTAELVQDLAKHSPTLASVERFFAHVANWPRVEQEADYARDAFRLAIEALEAIERWVASRTG